jgi:hypothetical protein
MKPSPILMTGVNVRAILEGRKTQTRRIIKGDVWKEGSGLFWTGDKFTYELSAPNGTDVCPFGRAGDELYVKETFKPNPYVSCEYIYRATEKEPDRYPGPWKPSIFMPRAASRITLVIQSVRVERLQDISEEDTIAEGIEKSSKFPTHWHCYSKQMVPENGGEYVAFQNPINSYKSLWESINGPGSWNLNPYVWVLEFTRKEKA